MLVCGPWGSGTSAVSGVLAELGLNGLPPYLHTRDERTPNSYESMAFREVVDGVASEKKLALTASRATIVERLAAFRDAVVGQEHGPYAGQPFFLKYPLSALVIPQICKVFRTRLIYLLRPLRQVEATRVRRHWALHTGAPGGQALYAAMFRALVEEPIPMPLMVPFADLLREPAEHAHAIARFVGLEPGAERVEQAARAVRSGQARAVDDTSVPG